MELLVVGAGDVGRWFADVVDAEVAFADVDPDAASAAASAAGGDARAVPADTDQRFDAVCVAVPLPAAEAAIERHASKAQTAVVDVTGAMEAPLTAMAAAAPERERASFHPLFAPETAPGTVAVSTDEAGPVADAMRQNLSAAGNDIVDVAPRKHDDAMRTVQGRTHAAVLAFALASRDDDVPAELATPVYERLAALVERVTGGTPRVYADVQTTFGGAEDVAAAAERLAEADPEEFARLYRDVR